MVTRATSAESNARKKMTVMCFFGSDNPLSPLIVSQLKAIKDAGYQADTDVLVYFDPNEKSARTRIYHVNNSRKEQLIAAGKEANAIGDGENPFVRNMMEDNVDPEFIDESKGEGSSGMKNALLGIQEPEAVTALQNFIGYSLENHPAEHYLLFLIGHGMIVGNDAFLPDEDPDSAISLIELEEILKTFSTDKGGTLELVGMHSCSMSGIEVAYQLKDVARYMIASQGTSFVGSLPYRQLLKKVFHEVKLAKEENRKINIDRLVEKIYSLSLYNSTDFMIAGYSSELALCNLQKIDALTPTLEAFVQLLKGGLNNGYGPLTELIVNAHWKAQAYWGDEYTDLCDFCRCLMEGCDKRIEPLRPLLPRDSETPSAAAKGIQALVQELEAVKKIAGELADQLEVNRSGKRKERFAKLVVRSEHFGWKNQFSHGLSVYFPWSEPLDVEATSDVPMKRSQRLKQDESVKRHERIMHNYENYKFSTELAGNSWWDFLKLYFDKTERPSRLDEFGKEKLKEVGFDESEFTALVGVAEGSFDWEGTLDPIDHKSSSAQGPGCSCPSIKNFKTGYDRNGRKVKGFSISPGALRAFKKFELPDIDPDDEDDDG